MVDQQRSGVLRDRLKATTVQVYDWIANMVDAGAAHRHLPQRRDHPARSADGAEEIRRLEGRLNLERDPRVREQMQATLVSSREQGDSLRELKGRMDRADLQLDHSLAALGTVYSQMLLIGSKDVDSDRTERLRDDIRDQVLALHDIIESLNEVYDAGRDDTFAVEAAAIRHQQTGKAGGSTVRIKETSKKSLNPVRDSQQHASQSKRSCPSHRVQQKCRMRFDGKVIEDLRETNMVRAV